jgi:uncharacterized protein YkwD
MILRPLLILLIFFGVLFYFKEPLSHVAPKFDQLHSAYADSFKKLFKEITSATSSAILNGNQNYIPSLIDSNSSSSGVKTSTATVIDDKIQNTSTDASPVANTNKELLPVVSNQAEQDLTIAGIISATNIERKKVGLSELIKDPLLSKAAEIKLQDMFQKQYFQHVSPSGDSVSDVVRKTGYEYIVVDEALAANDLQPKDLSWLIPHQANKRIISAMAERLNLSTDKVVQTIAKHGNTSAASIPLAWYAAIQDGRVKAGDLLLLQAMGGGFTWGAGLIRF